MNAPFPVRSRALRQYQVGQRIVRDGLFTVVVEHLQKAAPQMRCVDRAALAAQVVDYLIGEDAAAVRIPETQFAMDDALHKESVRSLSHEALMEYPAAREIVMATLQLREVIGSPADPALHPLQIRAENERAQSLLFTYATGPADPKPDGYLELVEAFAAELSPMFA